VKIDNTPPVLQLQSISPINSAGWSNGPATDTWTCFDAGSGPVTPTVTQTLNVSGSATASCSDIAGNIGSATQTGIKIDTTPPLVNLLSPLNNFTYPFGTTVFATYSCSDAVSGIASCTGTVPSGQRINTSTPGGPFSFSVTAVDLAGNQTTVTRTYSIGQPQQ
jgi:hypothetical protein